MDETVPYQPHPTKFGVGYIKYFSTATWFAQLRYFLIKFLAGKSVVILNAKIEPSEHDFDVVKDCKHGCLLDGNSFVGRYKISPRSLT
jgi:hypothetical protein